jgi:hypothetical protein
MNVRRPAPAPLPARGPAAARRPTESLPGAVMVVLAMVAAVVAVVLFVVLDYRFGQDPHRLIKILLGVTMFGTILVRPRVGLLLLPLLIPFLSWLPRVPVPGINTLNVLLFTIFFSWALARVFRREAVFRVNRLGAVLLALVVLAVLSIVRGSAFPTGYEYSALESSLDLFRAATGFAVYFIALVMVRGAPDRRRLAAMIVLALLLEAGVTIALGRSGRGSRAVGSLGQSNDLGAFLAMFTAFAAALVLGVRSLWARAGLALAVAAGTIATVLSVSRGAILALVVALAFVTIRTSRLMALALVLLLVASPLWAPDYLKARLMGTQVEVEGADAMELENSAQLRVDTWRAVGKVVSEHPLEGVGFSGLVYVLPHMGETMGVEVKDSAHNTYLRCLSEMGILGLVLFLIILWRCWKMSLDGMRVATERFDRQLALGLGAATLALAVSCAFGDRFFNILIMGNYWMACALVNDLLIEPREPA